VVRHYMVQHILEAYHVHEAEKKSKI
jgi:hypothetical protein